MSLCVYACPHLDQFDCHLVHPIHDSLVHNTKPALTQPALAAFSSPAGATEHTQVLLCSDVTAQMLV